MLKNIDPRHLFLIRLLAVYLLSKGVEHLIRTVDTLSFILSKASSWVATGSGQILGAFGFDWKVVQIGDAAQLYLDGSQSVVIAYSCNGISLILVFLAFIIATGYKNINSIWFIPLGALIVHWVNATRVAALAVIHQSRPDWVDFNHKYVFTIVVYSVIIALFLIWIKKYAKTDFKPPLD